MKRIKCKKDNKLSCVAEVCKLAAEYFYVSASDYSDEVELELDDTDANVNDALNGILEDMSNDNLYKEADHKTIKKIIKANYILVDLYRRVDYLASSNDHSWDNAVFNGAC